MKGILGIISISGIFGNREEELDILPPPPPFPKLGQKAKDERHAEKISTRKKNNEDNARRLEEKRQKRKKELKEKNRQKLEEQKGRERKEKLLSLLHGIGLVKTETEKKELQRKKEEDKGARELEKKRREQDLKKIKQERIMRKNEKKRSVMLERLNVQQEKQGQRELQEKISKKEEKMRRAEGKKQQEPERMQVHIAKKEAEKIEISLAEPERRKMTIKEHFAGLFPAIISFGKKEKQMEISEELQELPLPKKKGKAQKPMALKAEVPELMLREAKEKKAAVKEPDFLLKESEMASMPSNANDEEEIQKAIESLKQPERKSLLGRIFAKKEKMTKAQPQMTEEWGAPESTAEMPHVMPRTYDKIDHVEIAEAKMHQARMALMEFNFEEAKRIYVEIMGLCTRMEPKEKQEVYEDIRDLYYERKSAEKFAGK